MKHPCARCGKKCPADEMVYSRFTGNRYCGRDLAGCERRAAKRKRVEKREMVVA